MLKLKLVGIKNFKLEKFPKLSTFEFVDQLTSILNDILNANDELNMEVGDNLPKYYYGSNIPKDLRVRRALSIAIFKNDYSFSRLIIPNEDYACKMADELIQERILSPKKLNYLAKLLINIKSSKSNSRQLTVAKSKHHLELAFIREALHRFSNAYGQFLDPSHFSNTELLKGDIIESVNDFLNNLINNSEFHNSSQASALYKFELAALDDNTLKSYSTAQLERTILEKLTILASGTSLV